MVCDDTQGSCYFEKSCEQNKKTDSPMQIRMYDVSQSMLYSIAFNDMLVSGDNFGDSPDRCYFALFKSNLVRENEW